ncbi:MAG: AsmA family protein, partial [Pseudomonadota bacterium]
MNWLFRIFVGVGLLIVVALFSALLAPYFVNWERFTDEFEAQASRLVGQPVKVGGQSNLRLLPLPYISFEDLEVGRNADGSPLMTVEQFSLNAELFPFLSGEVRIVEMAMLRPRVNLKVEENGTIVWTSPRELLVAPAQVNIESLQIKDGSISLDGLAGGRNFKFEKIDGEITARSALGPWRIDASTELDGVSSSFKISTGTFQQSERSIRLKIEANRADQPYTIMLDGPIRLQEEVLNWAGDFSVVPFTDAKLGRLQTRLEPLPVYTEGKFLATPQRIEVPEFRMDVGSSDDPYTITGTGKASVKEKLFFRITADGRQIDLDRLKQSQDSAVTGTFESRLAVLRSILDRIPMPQAEGEIDIVLPAIVAGDTFIREVKTKVRPYGKSWDLRSFSAKFPGNTLVEATGRVGLREDFGFAGKVLVASRQPSGLAAWMSGGVDAQIRRLKTLGFASDAMITTKQAIFENLELRMDDAVLNGKLQRLASANGRAALFAEFQGNLVNIQDLRGLYSLTRDPADSKLASHDLDVKIKAEQLEAQWDDKPINAGEVDAHIRVREGSVSIERLNAGNFYGTELKSSGRLDDVLENPDGNFQLGVTAKSMVDLLEFGRDFAGDHPLLEAVIFDKSLSQDTDLNLELNARSSDKGSKGQLLIQGRTGDTDVNSRLAFVGDLSAPEVVKIDLQSSFSNQSVSMLARQFGIETLPQSLSGSMPGHAKFNLGLKGDASNGFDVQVRFSAPGTNVSGTGEAKFVSADNVEGYLSVILGSKNLSPYLLLT